MNKTLFLVYDLDMGGLQRVTTLIANELKYTGEDIEICSVEAGEPYYELAIPRRIVLEKKFNYTLFIKKTLRYLLFSLSFSKITLPFNFVNDRIIKKLTEIIIINKYNRIVACGDMTLYIPILKKKFPNIKFIAWEHNNAKTYMTQYFKRDIKTFVKSLKVSDQVVCLTKRDLIDYGEYTSRIRCIYNPVTIMNSQVSNLESKLISFVGRIDIDHKGIDYLVQIASKLPSPWQIVIAGDGTKKNKKKFNELIKQYGAFEKIIYKGPLKGEELQAHFFNSSIYVMTSRWEGMPLVLAEAMSFGLPIIAFEQTGSQEVLNNGEYGILVAQGDIEEMLNQINQLLLSKKLRQLNQLKSLERVKNFELDRIILRWKECLSSL